LSIDADVVVRVAGRHWHGSVVEKPACAVASHDMGVRTRLPLSYQASEVPGGARATSRDFAAPEIEPTLDPSRWAERITRSRRLASPGSGRRRETGPARVGARLSRDFHLARDLGETWHVGCSLAG